jgi:hypothetical protein
MSAPNTREPRTPKVKSSRPEPFAHFDRDLLSQNLLGASSFLQISDMRTTHKRHALVPSAASNPFGGQEALLVYLHHASRCV